MNLQATYRQNIFSSVEEMDTAVQAHIYHNATKLSDNYKNILRLLASYSLKTLGTCRLKVSTIAKEIGCSEVTVSRAIKRLKELNIIDIRQGTKLNGIQGANYYSILNFSHVMTERERERKLIERATHEIPCGSKTQDTKNHTESFNSFKTNLNPFVNSYITYSACGVQQDVKEQLRVIYQPQSVEDNHAFEELCKIAFGRLKQYMKSHNMPYLQMTDIIINCMKSLVNKENVRNPFAMYSAMIKRQVEQLFEAHIKPVQAFNKPSKEKIPDWFEKRNETVISGNNEGIDFEAERQKVLSKLGQGA